MADWYSLINLAFNYDIMKEELKQLA